MIKYRYNAVDINKKKINGIFLAKDKEDLRLQLFRQNIYLIDARASSEKSPNPFFSLTGKVSLRELTSFCRQFSIMINSSISIVECLKILRTQSYSGYFTKVLSLVYEDVNSGVLLSDAMRKHKRVFPDFFTNMVYVGELSGNLDKVLSRLADYYETDAKIKKKVMNAITYPIVLLTMLVAVMIIMMLFVVPSFRESLMKLDVKLPKITLIVFDTSEYFLRNWKTILLGIFAFVGLIYLINRSVMGRLFFDKLKVHTPLLGTITVNLATAKFARSFAILLSGGMDIVDSLENISIVIGNKDIEKRFNKALDDIKRGQTISMSFEKYKLFPDILNQMISVGEKTGELTDVLERSCVFFDEEVENSSMRMTSILQPLMLLIMGVSIGVVFVAIYSPMLAIMQEI